MRGFERRTKFISLLFFIMSLIVICVVGWAFFYDGKLLSAVLAIFLGIFFNRLSLTMTILKEYNDEYIVLSSVLGKINVYYKDIKSISFSEYGDLSGLADIHISCSRFMKYYIATCDVDEVYKIFIEGKNVISRNSAFFENKYVFNAK